MVSWAVTTSTATAGHVVRGVMAGESPAQVVEDITATLRGAAQGALGLPSSNGAAGPDARPIRARATVTELRARGAELLARSADVWYSNDAHPAYARILDELEPDEARILRFLAIDGPQPSVDIRTNRPLGRGSEAIESGLSMIGLQAGVRKLARTRADLNNLYRLGLIWFSREEVSDPSRYQVVEVQPDVQEAIKKAGRSPKIVRRSVILTPFGEDFCRTCFPLDGRAGPPEQS
jgi:Abortive infection alpha